MIYTLTVNPSIDYYATTEHMILGTTNRTSSEIMKPGGKGINVSMVLKNLGRDSIALGFIAGFVGDEIARLISEEDIATDFIRVSEGTSRINVKIRSGGQCIEETELNGMGPKIGDAHIDSLFNRLDELKGGDILVMAGAVPSRVSNTLYADICKRVSGRGVMCIVDATGELLLKSLETKPFLVKPNAKELGDLFGVKINDRTEAMSYAHKLQDMGARNVCVSMSGDGAILICENGHVYSSPAPQGELINSVGAGDSMVAGFIDGYLMDSELDQPDMQSRYENAFYRALCAGSASAFSEGMATREKIDELMKFVLKMRI